MTTSLYFKYLSEIFDDLDAQPSMKLSGSECTESLWFLNEVFRSRYESICKLKYNKRFEVEADAAIAALTKDTIENAWSDITSGAWRVLLERHMQFTLVCTANELQGRDMFTIPHGLTSKQRSIALMLSWLHGMELPWPPEDRSNLQLPDAQT